MPLRHSPPKNEADAVQQLVRDIDSIDADKNKVGRYVLLVFAFVFIMASILLGVIITSN
jgi:hypothetical protein